MNIIPKDDLHTLINTLAYSHLGQAIDSMRRSYDLVVSAKTGYEKIAAHQFAITSIIHGFCFLDSLVNDLGYRLLFSKESDQYIQEEDRDFLTKKFAASWNLNRCLDKLTFLSEKLNLDELSNCQKEKLSEINNLRNILMHGISYSTTLLLEPTDKNTWKVHDQEDSIDLEKKFPANKFNAPVNLNYSDSKKCLEVILDVCKRFYERHSMGLGISTSYPSGNYDAFYGENIDFTEILKLPAV